MSSACHPRTQRWAAPLRWLYRLGSDRPEGLIEGRGGRGRRGGEGGEERRGGEGRGEEKMGGRGVEGRGGEGGEGEEGRGGEGREDGRKGS